MTVEDGQFYSNPTVPSGGWMWPFWAWDFVLKTFLFCPCCMLLLFCGTPKWFGCSIVFLFRSPMHFILFSFLPSDFFFVGQPRFFSRVACDLMLYRWRETHVWRGYFRSKSTFGQIQLRKQIVEIVMLRSFYHDWSLSLKKVYFSYYHFC